MISRPHDSKRRAVTKAFIKSKLGLSLTESEKKTLAARDEILAAREVAHARGENV